MRPLPADAALAGGATKLRRSSCRSAALSAALIVCADCARCACGRWSAPASRVAIWPGAALALLRAGCSLNELDRIGSDQIGSGRCGLGRAARAGRVGGEAGEIVRRRLAVWLGAGYCARRASLSERARLKWCAARYGSEWARGAESAKNRAQKLHLSLRLRAQETQ